MSGKKLYNVTLIFVQCTYFCPNPRLNSVSGLCNEYFRASSFRLVCEQMGTGQYVLGWCVVAFVNFPVLSGVIAYLEYKEGY